MEETDSKLLPPVAKKQKQQDKKKFIHKRTLLVKNGPLDNENEK